MAQTSHTTTTSISLPFDALPSTNSPHSANINIALDQIHSTINNRGLGDRRYNWSNVIFSLKPTKSQKDTRRELTEKIDQRIETARAQGISTMSPLGDLTQLATRQLYVNLLMLLNTTYPDYDFTSTPSDSFIPTTPQQFLTQLSEDIFLPLNQDLNSESNPNMIDLRQNFILAVKEALGFDLLPISEQHSTTNNLSIAPPAMTISQISNNNNNDNDINEYDRGRKMVMDDEEVLVPHPHHALSPNQSQHHNNNNNNNPQDINDTMNQSLNSLDTSFLSTASSSATMMITPNQSQVPPREKEFLIFELDNDGDNPLFSSKKLWTKVYLLYSYPLKRVAIITASCKSTQTIYSPALKPLHHNNIDEFQLQPTVPSKRHYKSTHRNSLGSRCGNGDCSSDDDEDDNFKQRNDGFGTFGIDDDDDDDDGEDSDYDTPPHHQHHADYDYHLQNDGMMKSPRTEDDFEDDDRVVGDNNGDSSDSEDEFYLYGAATIPPPSGSLGYQSSHASRTGGNNTDLSVGGNESTGTYTNHVELVQNSDGEVEIVPLTLDHRSLALLQKQQQQPNPTPGLRNRPQSRAAMNQTPDFTSSRG